MPRVSSQAAHDVSIPPSKKFSVQELAGGGPDIVVVPADAEIRKLCANEKFMNEIIKIRLHATGDINAPKAVELSIQTGGITGAMGPATPEFPNGTPGKAGRGGKTVNYVFEYERVYPVPRFVYEALAHAKTTSLRQTPHPTRPMEMVQQNVHSFFYNFECVADPNPKGQPWREFVLAQPA